MLSKLEERMNVMKEWNQMPAWMQNEAVRQYYDILKQRRSGLRIKRSMDVVLSVILIIFFLPLMLVVGVLIKRDSRGPIFFRQVRITTYGRRFRIWKFRTMVQEAAKLGGEITTLEDRRITKIGMRLRKYRIDEIPQLFNVLSGEMSFVGTRPEVEKYVRKYTDEMKATLLLPAGLTSMASIKYKDEEQLLQNAAEVDKTYIEAVLPDKMEYNLKELKNFNCWSDIKTMVKTITSVIGS